MTVQYFIDSENVGDFWIPLLDLPAEKTELIVFYTRNSPHMSYESLIRLKESDRKVTFIKCYEGTNALDFQLVSELGFHICQDEDDRFVIVTNDTGFDAAVKYWRRKKKSVKRITGKECRNLERRIREDLQSGQMQERNTAASEIRYTVEDQDAEQALQENELQDKQTLSADRLFKRTNCRISRHFPQRMSGFPVPISGMLSAHRSPSLMRSSRRKNPPISPKSFQIIRMKSCLTYTVMDLMKTRTFLRLTRIPHRQHFWRMKKLLKMFIMMKLMRAVKHPSLMRTPMRIMSIRKQLRKSL